MSTARKYEVLSASDYLAEERLAANKSEYVCGIVHAQAGGSNAHGLISSNVLVALGAQLRGKPYRALNSETKIRIVESAGTRFYYPDASVVCKPNPPEDTFHDQPVAVVEVVSPSTRRIDLGEKREAYLRIPSLKHYVILEQDSVAAISLTRTATGFQERRWEGVDAEVELPAIGCKLLLCEVYETVEFP